MFAQLTARKTLTTARPAAPLTIRFADAADAAALALLADLDSSHVPAGDVLLAEVGDELWAALSLADGHAIADPLRPSADAVLLLGQRARQLHKAQRRATRRSARLRFAH